MEEKVAVRRELLCRWHAVLRDHMSKLHAENVAVEVHGLGGVAASIRNMVQLLDVHLAILEHIANDKFSKIERRNPFPKRPYRDAT